MKKIPVLKAAIAVCILFIISFCSFVWMPGELSIKVVLGILFLIFLAHTFLSVRVFASITNVWNTVQNIFDAILFILLIVCAFKIGDAKYFIFCTTLVFAVASIKYQYLLKSSKKKYSNSISRKIYIENIGTLICILALGGVILGYVLTTLTILTVLYIVMSAYLFFVRPLYKLSTRQ